MPLIIHLLFPELCVYQSTGLRYPEHLSKAVWHSSHVPAGKCSHSRPFLERRCFVTSKLSGTPAGDLSGTSAVRASAPVFPRGDGGALTSGARNRHFQMTAIKHVEKRRLLVLSSLPPRMRRWDFLRPASTCILYFEFIYRFNQINTGNCLKIKFGNNDFLFL